MSKAWIDPASGWMYGFPKVWDSKTDPPIKEWLVKQGLPTNLVDLPVRMWKYTEEDYGSKEEADKT